MKSNLAQDIRKYAIPARQKIENELEGVTQILARASDRIENLETALRYIAKHGRPIGIIDKVAKDALKNS